jgi:transposase
VLKLPDLAQIDQAVPQRIFLCSVPTDMRRSFDSLAMIVEQFMGADPLSGDLFCFRSRGADRIKILAWDGDGYILYYKRLEEGTFRFPTATPAGAASVRIKPTELAMLLEGIDLKSIKRGRRYRRDRAKTD